MARAPELRIDRSPAKALRVFDADRLRWLDEAAARGPLVALRLGPLTTWVITDADVARVVLQTDGGAWKRPPVTLVPARVAVGENLFTQREKAWSRLQPLLAPSLRKKALEPRLGAIDALIAGDVGAIARGVDVDLELMMARIALRLAAFVLLGEDLEPSRADEIARNEREVTSWVGEQLGRLTGLVPFPYGARGRDMKRHRAVLRAYADEVIARRRAAPRTDDVLGALMQARPGGKPLSTHELRGHVLGLFLAGNETTGAALSWAIVHGAAHPAEWVKLRTEPDRWVAPFVDETLRITPAVWGVPRVPAHGPRTLTSDGVTAQVRRSQVANTYLRGMNRNAQMWTDPLRFDPSRHLAADISEKRALLPFGLGPRGCVGQQLALAEMYAVLPALARHGDVVVEQPVTENPRFALRVDGGLRGRFVAP